MNVHVLPVRARSIIGPVKRTPTPTSVAKAVRHDPRWPQVESVLAALSASGRRAVRIVDAECGTGALLLEALKQARRLGFTAIEGYGIDRSPSLIGRARAAATRCADPAIGADFAVADIVTALRAEQDLPADILLCHDTARVLRNAGRIVIDDGAAVRGIAA